MKTMLGLMAVLLGGCYAELAGGYYKAGDVNGSELDGYIVGANAGVFYDHKQEWRGSVGGGMSVAPADGGNVQSQMIQLQGDYQFAHWGTQSTLGVCVGLGYGNNKITPDSGPDVDGDGTFEGFGGLVVTLPFTYNRNFAYQILGGLDYQHIDVGPGSFNAVGVGVRARLTWSPWPWVREVQ